MDGTKKNTAIKMSINLNYYPKMKIKKHAYLQNFTLFFTHYMYRINVRKIERLFL